MPLRRMLPFILINIVVSAAVVLAILTWWDSRESSTQAEANIIVTAIASPASLNTPAPAPVLENTPEPEPDDSPFIHVVKAGETLGSLSEFYEVPLEDIMTVNDISNPNLISVGQQLLIPIGGIPTPTPVPESSPGPASNVLPTPIATDEPLSSGEAVVEITAVTGAGDLTQEAVQITNLGGRQIALLNWKLADANNHVFTFGQVTLFGDGAAIQLHTESGQNGPADLYWGLETPIWESGERVTLLDAEGTIRATFDIP